MKIVLIILGIQIVYVSFFTIRMILTLKRQIYLASVLSAFEVFIYMSGLALVLDNLDNPINLIAYCIGYALGVLVGTRIEEKMALGYVVMQIIVNCEDVNLANTLREKGYGVTSWLGEGRDGNRFVLEVLTKRKNEESLFNLVESINKSAFIISYEPRTFKGGFWVKKLKKGCVPNNNV